MNDIFEELDKLYEDVQVDQEAAKQFYAALKANPAYIDTEAFHKAYDELIKKAYEGTDINPNDLFIDMPIRDDFGALVGKWIYGKIKECPDSYAQNVLKKLWAAQYVDHLKTKKYYDDQAKRDQERKEAEEKRAKEKAEFDARVKEVKDAAIAGADKIRAEAVKLLDQNVLDKYKKVTGDDKIVDKLIVEPRNKQSNSDDPETYAGFTVHIEGERSYYDLNKPPYDAAKIAKCFDGLIKEMLKDAILTSNSNRIKDDISSFCGNKIRWDTLYFLNRDKSLLYNVKRNDSNRYNLSVYEIDANTGWEEVDVDDYPNFNKLDLVGLDNVVTNQTGRCYFHYVIHKYYDPELVDQRVGTVMGLDFKEWEGDVFDVGVRFLQPEEIPVDCKAFGLTAGERHSNECDSSD